MASQAAASQVLDEEIEALFHEIRFQKVLLSSLDDTVENRAEAEREIQGEIESLEKKIRALKRANSKSSQSSQARSPQPSASARIDKEIVGSAGTGSGYEAENRPRNFASSSPNPRTPNSSKSANFLDTPSRMSLPSRSVSRKRSHSTHIDDSLAPPESNKLRRTTPSPYDTEAPTPSTSDVSDDEFEMFDNVTFSKQQQQLDKIKQEREDAEFARNLSSGRSSLLSAGPSNVRTAFDRMGVRPSASLHASANTMQSGASHSRKQPPSSMHYSSQVKREPVSSSANGFHPYPPSSSGHANQIKSKTSIKNDPARNMPGAFGDDSSAASDSDIELIPPEAFRDNNRLPRTPQSFAAEAARRRLEQGPVYTSQHTALYNDGDLPAYLANMAAGQQPNSLRDPDTLPGSFPHPVAGFRDNTSYSGMQASGGIANLPGYNETVGELSLNSPAGQYPAYGYNNGTTPGLGSFPNLNPFSNPPDHMSAFARPHDIGMADQFDYIVNDPRKTNEEIQTLLQNIRPDADLPAEDREGTPDGLVYPLYEHQKLALTWMKSMEEGTNKGGILADDMGLGKTISTLALMLSRQSTDQLCKTTLIVGPVALVRQWDREMRTKVKASHRLSVYMYHGSQKKPAWDDLRNFDVVLSTYGTVAAEFKRLEKWLAQQKSAGHENDYDRAPMKKLFPLLGPKSAFYRIVLDEAQYIKNKLTGSSRAAKHLQAKTRFCLTGTPMMNNVNELYSLIHFLRIRPYNEWSRFNDAFGLLTKGDATQRTVKAAMKKLQAVIKAILLRRTKTSLIDGKPIINLPPKSEEIQHVVFNEAEQDYYNSLESKTKIQFNKYLRANTVGKNYSNVLVLLLRLRQACCHPHLIQDFEEASPTNDVSMETMVELAKTLSPAVIGRLKEAESFECPVCYDAVDNPTIFLPCGHYSCAECLTGVADGAAQRAQADGNEGSTGLRCPECRGEINLKKLIDNLTFKKVHMPERAPKDDAVDVSETESDTDSDSDTESDSGSEDDADGNGNLRNFIVPDDIETEDEAGDEAEDKDDGDDEATRYAKRKTRSKARKEKRRKSKGKKKEKTKPKSLALLKKEASRSAKGRREYMKHLRKHWEPSAKVDKCIDLIGKFQKDGKKTIIFSQFVSLLDLVQVPIDKQHWKCERYDGSMNADDRHAAIVRFTDDPSVKIMLISLKAGNAGLNLVAASRVIILDPFWNPFIEMQAVDRAYRIGQQNPVEVHRILIQGTVEDRIIELQEKKRKLVESALDEVASKEVGRLDVRQLAFLFGVDPRVNAT